MLGLFSTMIKFAFVRNCSVCAYTCMGICFNKPGSKPVVYVHDTLLVQCCVESLMLFLVFS